MNKERVIEKLKRFIGCNHETQASYATSMGVSRQFVTNVLNGTDEPTSYMLHDIGILKTKVTVYSEIKDK